MLNGTERVDGVWRWLAWLPLLSPLTAGVIILFWPAAWWGFFGKETISEHQSHILLAVIVVLFVTRYLRHSRQIPGDLLFAIGSLGLVLEETDYGLLYLRRVTAAAPDLNHNSFHNTSIGIALFLVLPVCFALLPFLFASSSAIRRRWLVVPRATAASVGVCVLFLLATQLTDYAVEGYLLREGADETHDLGVTLALLVTALHPIPTTADDSS
jgi:glucan phosphoethanolaminetransferase (alkaline phosphatase superfamily)